MILGIKNKTVKNIYYQDFNPGDHQKGRNKPEDKTEGTARASVYADTLELKRGLRITLDYDNYTSTQKEYKVHIAGDMEEVKYVGSYQILGEADFHPVKSVNTKKFKFSYGTSKNTGSGFIINIKV